MMCGDDSEQAEGGYLRIDLADGLAGGTSLEISTKGIEDGPKMFPDQLLSLGQLEPRDMEQTAELGLGIQDVEEEGHEFGQDHFGIVVVDEAGLEVVAEFDPIEVRFQRGQEQVWLSGKVAKQGSFIEGSELGYFPGSCGFETVTREELSRRFDEPNFGDTSFW